MTVDNLKSMIAQGQVHSGDILTSDGTGWLSNALDFFAGRRSHAMQLFNLKDIDWTLLQGMDLSCLPANVGDFDGWVLAESTFEVDGGGHITANGPRIVPLWPRLAGDSSIFWVSSWSPAATSLQVAGCLRWWLGKIAGHTVYGLGEIALLLAWESAKGLLQDDLDFYTTGIGRFLWPWCVWRRASLTSQLAFLIANPPVPAFHEIVCSPSVAFACQNGGLIGPDVKCWGVTPLDVTLWPGLLHEVEL